MKSGTSSVEGRTKYCDIFSLYIKPARTPLAARAYKIWSNLIWIIDNEIIRPRNEIVNDSIEKISGKFKMSKSEGTIKIGAITNGVAMIKK